MDDNSGSISSDELLSLSKVMQPHLNLFRLVRQYPDAIVPPDASLPYTDSDPTLFCTYVKPGFVHILAFSLDENAEVTSYLIDSLPVALCCETEDDLLDRMRIVLALFTLRRQVVKISDHWSPICWPMNVLADEHKAIVEVTKIHSPTASVDGPPPSDAWSFDNVFFDIDTGDESQYLEEEIRASCVRVKRWLAKVEPLDEPNAIVY